MTVLGPGAAAAVAARREWYRARVLAGWPHVQIKAVEVVHQGACRRARAVIYLGGLSPMEVQVELLPASSHDARRRGDEDARMWSTHSQDNGCFVYERAFPADGDGIDWWLIRTRPAENVYVHDVEQRFRAS